MVRRPPPRRGRRCSVTVRTRPRPSSTLWYTRRISTWRRKKKRVFFYFFFLYYLSFLSFILFSIPRARARAHTYTYAQLTHTHSLTHGLGRTVRKHAVIFFLLLFRLYHSRARVCVSVMYNNNQTSSPRRLFVSSSHCPPTTQPLGSHSVRRAAAVAATAGQDTNPVVFVQRILLYNVYIIIIIIRIVRACVSVRCKHTSKCTVSQTAAAVSSDFVEKTRVLKYNNVCR